MRRLIVRALAVLPVLLVLVPLHVWPGERMVAEPFDLHITDTSGHPLRGLRVISDNGIVCRTQGDGSIRWTEASVMDRDVRFHIATPQGNRDVTVHVERGGRTNVRLPE